MICKNCGKNPVPLVREHHATPCCFACVRPLMSEMETISKELEEIVSKLEVVHDEKA